MVFRACALSPELLLAAPAPCFNNGTTNNPTNGNTNPAIMEQLPSSCPCNPERGSSASDVQSTAPATYHNCKPLRDRLHHVASLPSPTSVPRRLSSGVPAASSHTRSSATRTIDAIFSTNARQSISGSYLPVFASSHRAWCSTGIPRCFIDRLPR